MSVEEQAEAERLADEWGLGEILRGDRPATPGGTQLPFPRMHDVEAADETASMPDLDRPRLRVMSDVSNGILLRDTAVVTGAEGVLQPGPRIKILDGKATPPSRLPRRHTMLDAERADLPDFSFDADLPLPSLEDLTLDTTSSRLSQAAVSSDRDGRGSSGAVSPRPLSSMSRHLSPVEPSEEAPWASSDTRPGGGGPSAGRTRTDSTFSAGLTAFTSRFDPAMIQLAKAEIAKDRPVFVNKLAGAPPKIVLMPAPLAGRPPSPPPKIRAEGPESDDEEEQRPPGALYGRSLLDVMTERQEQLKSRQKQYVRAQDGRATMHDWAGTPAGQALLRHNAEADAASLAPMDQLSVHRMPRSVSVFGPDLIYARDLEKRRELDEVEARERKVQDELDAAMREKLRLKEEKKRRGLFGKRRPSSSPNRGAGNLDQNSTHPCGSSDAHADPYAAFTDAQPSPQPDVSQTPPRQRGHALVPSLSLPAGLASSSSLNGEWAAIFAKPDSPPTPRKRWTEEEEAEEASDWEGRFDSVPRRRGGGGGTLEAPSQPTLSRSESQASSLNLPTMPVSAGSSWSALSRPTTEDGQEVEMPRDERSPAQSLGDGARSRLHAEQDAQSTHSHDSDSDEDAMPLGLRRAPPQGDLDDAPLALLHGGHQHRLHLGEEGEDDVPLAFRAPAVHQQQHFERQQWQQHQDQLAFEFAQQQQAQPAYECAIAAQQQQQMMLMQAEMQQQQFYAAQMQQMAYEGSMMGGLGGGGGSQMGMAPGLMVHPGEQVDKWRRDVE